MKRFGLGAFGLVVACGGKTGGVGAPDDGGGGFVVDGSVARSSSSSSSSSSSGSTSSSSSTSSTSSSSGSSSGDDGDTCPQTIPVDAADLPWAPPKPLDAGKCSEADITALQNYLQQNPATTNAQFIQFAKMNNPTCAACTFTDAALPTWGAIPVSNGDVVTINIGACYALVSGVEACGKAVQNEYDCEFAACADCIDDVSFDACRTKSQKGACQAFVLATSTDCNGVPAGVDNVCGSFFDSIRAQCIAIPTP